MNRSGKTPLDGAGHTARQIADQLGQAKVSVTQDLFGSAMHEQLPVWPTADVLAIFRFGAVDDVSVGIVAGGGARFCSSAP
jgi:hypothetical protein